MNADPVSKYTRLMVASQAPVARIIFSNPPVNVIDIPMMDELLAVLEEFEQRAEIVGVIFAGSDAAFSAGLDVAAHTRNKAREMLTKFHSVIRAILKSSKVTISSVRGSCLGGGAELAAVCDMVFTTDDARWGFPEISLGCFPPVAAAMLSIVVGQKAASELVLTGRIITGEDALRIGLANDALPEDELSELLDETTERLSQLSPSALRVTKKAMYAWDAAHVEKGLARAEQIYLEELMKLEDPEEGIAAFLQKRKPVWTGK